MLEAVYRVKKKSGRNCRGRKVKLRRQKSEIVNMGFSIFRWSHIDSKSKKIRRDSLLVQFLDHLNLKNRPKYFS